MEAGSFDDEQSSPKHRREAAGTRAADADLRDAEADLREVAADERERHIDARERMLDRWEGTIAARAADLYALDGVDEEDREQARLQRERDRERRRDDAEGRREAAIERDIQRAERAARANRPPDAPPGSADPAPFVRLVAAAQADRPLRDVIDLVLEVAVDTVPGCAAASIALEANGRMQPAAATVPWAADLDTAQLESGCGPMAAAATGGIVVTNNLAADERWPRLADLSNRDAERGAMSFGLVVSGTTAGVLTLYSDLGSSFPDHAFPLGDLLAAHATVTLGRTVERLTFEAQAEAWQRALASRDAIGQAKGILMQQRSTTADEAFHLLRETSQLLNIKLRKVAEHVVSERRLPEV